MSTDTKAASIAPAKALAKMTDDELAAEEARVAALRTEVRLAQNAIVGERETRQLLAGLSGGAREVVRARLSGSISSSGGTSATEGGKE